uniref:Uncharacterized protein n=1 Tax=Sphaerodactylus townsendi TaxID=933632 RepID=A0ACB8F5T5_9SAUR
MVSCHKHMSCCLHAQEEESTKQLPSSLFVFTSPFPHFFVFFTRILENLWCFLDNSFIVTCLLFVPLHINDSQRISRALPSIANVCLGKKRKMVPGEGWHTFFPL